MPEAIGDSDTVDTVLKRFPETAAVFLAHRMACVGCALASFQRIRDVADAYDIEMALLLEDLRAAVRATSGPTGHQEV